MIGMESTTASQARKRPWSERLWPLGGFDLTNLDKGVIALFALGCALPALATLTSDRLGPSVVAERDVIVSNTEMHTVWPGGEHRIAARQDTPLWARDQLNAGRRLNAALALATPPATIEVDPAPLWSPHLATLARPTDEGAEGFVQIASLDPDAFSTYRAGAPYAAPRPIRRPDALAVTRVPRISIVLTAVGINEPASREALARLPAEIAFAIAPVGRAPGDWAAASRRDGRVTLLELPMEPVNFPRVNPGPLTLRTDATPEANIERVTQAVGLLGRIDGVSTYLGGRFKSDPAALRPVIRELRERELFVFENGATEDSRLSQVARDLGLPMAATPIRLDMNGRATDISAALARLENQAARDGAAVGVAVAVPSTIDALAEWARELNRRGFQLTPLRP